MEERLYFAAKALIVKNKQFLGLKRTEAEHDLWDLPGGRMDFGETLEQTLHREVQEETSLHIEPIKILSSWDKLMTDFQISGVIYLCGLVGGEIALSPEHAEFAWFDLGDYSKLYPFLRDPLLKASIDSKSVG